MPRCLCAPAIIFRARLIAYNVRRFKKLRFAIYEVNLKRLLCDVLVLLKSIRRRPHAEKDGYLFARLVVRATKPPLTTTVTLCALYYSKLQFCPEVSPPIKFKEHEYFTQLAALCS